MSAETLGALRAAIQNHLADVDDEKAVLTDWFVAYGSMRHNPDTPDGIMHGANYATSDGSPQGALGIATLGLSSLSYDLTDDDE